MNDETIQDRILPLLPSVPGMHLTVVGVGPTAPILDRIADTFVYCDRSADLAATLAKLLGQSQGVVTNGIHIAVNTTSMIVPACASQVLPAAQHVTADTSAMDRHCAIPLTNEQERGARLFVEQRNIQGAEQLGVCWRGAYLTVKNNGTVSPIVNTEGSNMYDWEHPVRVGELYTFVIHVRAEPNNSVRVRIPRIGTKIVTSSGRNARRLSALAIAKWDAWMGYVYQLVQFMDRQIACIANCAPTRLARERLRHVYNTRGTHESLLWVAMHRNEVAAQTTAWTAIESQ